MPSFRLLGLEGRQRAKRAPSEAFIVKLIYIRAGYSARAMIVFPAAPVAKAGGMIGHENPKCRSSPQS
jgi:hypothetical protein